MDRDYHWASKAEDNEEMLNEYWANTTVRERLEVTFYLNSAAYNFDINNPPRMDRIVFFNEEEFLMGNIFNSDF
ncbi:MAG: hypothetical protein ACRCVT_05580 [Leadbetterella sp.]